MLSPGVKVKEIDLSIVVPTVSKSITAFAGDFEKGPIGKYVLITNPNDLIAVYGKVKNDNYNDWFQAYNFLQYGNKLLISRAGDINGTIFESESKVKSLDNNAKTITIAGSTELEVGNFILPTKDSDRDLECIVRKIDTDSSGNAILTVGQDCDLTQYQTDVYLGKVEKIINGIAINENEGSADIDDSRLHIERLQILNEDDFEIKEESIPMDKDEKIKFFGKTPGTAYNGINIAIAREQDFESGLTEAFEGIYLNDLFESVPSEANKEIALMIKEDDEIKETYIVSLDPEAKDFRGKTIFIDEILKRNSSLIYSKTNVETEANPQSRLAKGVYIADDGSNTEVINKQPLEIKYGEKGNTGVDDIMNAYGSVSANSIFGNKEEIDVDIIIANELTRPYAAKLAKDRGDCIAFIGASFDECVGLPSTKIVENLIKSVKTGELSSSDARHSYAAFFGNYKYQYDKFRDKNVWVSLTGDVAGLRADTNTKRDTWWASAGLERGQIKGAKKIAFNPNNGQRDLLYKNNINPVVSFPGQGNAIVWGQKTLQAKASAFDRINVRGLFNTLERAISRMAKHFLFEFNDEFTRNRFVATIQPFLDEVKAGRGVYDYYILCDESNNGPEVVDHNEFHASIAVKPTRVAEFITLSFIAVPTGVDFKEIFS